MYRSLLTVDLKDPSFRQALGNAQDMHRNLMRAFTFTDTETPRAEESLLYTIMEDNNTPVLYVLSRNEPDWAKVRGVSLYQRRPPVCADALRDKFMPGTVLSFRLFASPTKKVAREGKLSARKYLELPEERRDWLLRHAQKGGFAVKQYTEEKTQEVTGFKKSGKVYHKGVVFSGILEITDRDAFWKAYCEGIGPGKAYGLGMLLVKKV